MIYIFIYICKHSFTVLTFYFFFNTSYLPFCQLHQNGTSTKTYAPGRFLWFHTKTNALVRHWEVGRKIRINLFVSYRKVIHSGLEQFPMIYQSKSNRIISMMYVLFWFFFLRFAKFFFFLWFENSDFDNSRIRNLTNRSVNVKAESL